MDPHTTLEGVTLFYMAKNEIWDVYAALNRGELEKVHAETMLRKVLHAFADLLARLFLAALEGGTIAVVFFTLRALELAFGTAALDEALREVELTFSVRLEDLEFQEFDSMNHYWRAE